MTPIRVTLLSPRNPVGSGDARRWILRVEAEDGSHSRMTLMAGSEPGDMEKAMQIAAAELGFQPEWQPIKTVEGWPPSWQAPYRKKKQPTKAKGKK